MGRIVASALGLALTITGAAPSAAAMSAGTTATTAPPSLDQQIKSAKDQVEEASAEEAKLLSQIDASAARKKDLDAAVANLDGQVRALQGKVDAAQSRLSAVEAKEADAKQRLDETQAALSEAKAHLARQAIAAYTGQTDAVAFIEATLKSHDIGELIVKREYVKAVTGTQRETVLLTEKLRNQVDDLHNQLAQATAQAQAERDTVTATQDGLKSQRDAQAATQAKVAAEIAEGTRLKNEALSRKKEFQAQADALQAESDQIAATLRGRQSSGGSGGPVAPAGGRFSSPIPGAPIVSGFGPRVHPIYGDVRVHTGVDFAADEGTPILAAGDGVVVMASEYGGYGNATIIDHGGGLATLYGHQSAILVSEGQSVRRGQVIGRVGCTGACTGPHLHFEVRVNGTPVNPVPYLS
jgi:murein DD-endopeptidase MepM/ murein hydrolase activator NlpD